MGSMLYFGNAMDILAGGGIGYVTGFVKWWVVVGIVVGIVVGYGWLIMPKHELSLY